MLVFLFLLFLLLFVSVVLINLGNCSSVTVYDCFLRHKNCITKSTFLAAIQSSLVSRIG